MDFIELIDLMKEPLWQTIYMVFFSTLFATIVGLPLGVIVTITEEGHIYKNSSANKVLNILINGFRSMPFIILMIAVFPLAKLIVGTRIGTTATIVPLTIAAIPFVARLVESAIKEVDWGVIEASLAMGASVMKIIFDVLIGEALPAIILAITTTAINLIGYSAMAGAIGGGGLGDLAIRYGYQGFRTEVIIATIIVLLVLVQGIQFIGNVVRKKLTK